jgi:hypothetical protein
VAAPPAASQTRYDVFISYPGRERAWAHRLAADLAAHGLQAFSDLRLEPGDSWPDALADGLSASGVLVVLWSEAATESENMRIARQPDRRDAQAALEAAAAAAGLGPAGQPVPEFSGAARRAGG